MGWYIVCLVIGWIIGKFNLQTKIFNAIVAGIENPVIAIAKSDRAAAPFRRGGRKAKRCHVYIEIRNKEIKK